MIYKIERKPDNFDWVKARLECSIAAMFARLKVGVENDVIARNETRPKNTNYSFRFIPPENKPRFSVMVEGSKIYKTIEFELKGDVISVTEVTGKKFDIFATICDDGECRAKVGNQELDSWQVRKMALEDFLFRYYQAELS